MAHTLDGPEAVIVTGALREHADRIGEDIRAGWYEDADKARRARDALYYLAGKIERATQG